MAVFKKGIALLLVLTIFISMGDGLAFASAGLDAPPDPESSVAAEEGQQPAPEAEETDGGDGEQAPQPEASEIAPEPSQPEQSEEPSQPEQSDEPDQPEENEAGEQDEPGTAAVQPEHKVWPWTEPGNTAASILGGGWTLEAGSGYYYSENGIWLQQGGAAVKLSDARADNLNLSGQWLYYTSGDTVWRMSAAGGAAESVYTADGQIWQMYVMGDELRMTVDGAVVSYDMAAGVAETLDAPADVKGLIPTPYGNLYLTGELFAYDLWAEKTQLLSAVDSAYPEGDWLVVVTGGATYQTDLADLFSGAVSLQSYSLHRDEAAAISDISDEEALAQERAYLESDQYLAMQAALVEYANNGIDTISTSTVLTKKMTANQQNIVLRAQQMAEVKWTPVKTITAWGGNDPSYISTKSDSVYRTDNGKFIAGKTYKGVPYAQAVGTGYVGWEISLGKFLQEVDNASSPLYTSYSTYGRRAPYYGSDCSGFVSYAWDLPYRCPCSTLVNFSELIGSPNKDNVLYKLQVGDCLNLTSEHVVLVTDIGYDSQGRVVSVEITEQTPSKMRVSVYGEVISGRTYEYQGQLSYIYNYYLTKGYKIYRRDCSSRPSVREPNDDAKLSYAPAPTMTVTAQGPASAKITLSHASSGTVIYYTTDGSAPSTSSTQYTGPFTVSKSTKVRAIAKVPGYLNSFPLNEQVDMATQPTLRVVGSTDNSGVFLSGGVYYADGSKKLTLSAASGATIYYTTNGADPTLNSNRVTSSTGIEVQDDLVIKAFAVAKGVPSQVAVFQVKAGKLYTITVDDPFGFVSPNGSASVLEGSTVTFQFGSVNGYTLGNVKVDGENLGVVSKYTFSNVQSDHTIKAEIKLPFNDVPTGSWYVDAVAFATNKGLFNGTSSTRFEPETAMNRAMFITVLGRYAKLDSTIANWTGRMGLTNGTDIYVRSSTSTSSSHVTILAASGQYIKVKSIVPASQSKDGAVWYQVEYNGKTGYVRSVMPSNNKTLMYVCQFNDLTSSDISYCAGYAQWANLQGIINGTSTTTYSPTAAISRQDICVILYKYLTGYRGMSIPAGSASFNDLSKVESYALTAVKAMASIGVITGDNKGNFNPTAAATRAEVATIFMRLDKYLNG